MKKEKIREVDYNPNELPKDRKAQFFDLAKNRFLDIFKLTVLLDLFILPLFIVYLLFSTLITGSDPSNAYSLFFYMFLLFVPCIWILYIGLGGIAEPLKQLIWGEGLFGPSAFFKGIKRNLKASIIAGVIESISMFAFSAGSLFLLTHGPQSDGNWINGTGVGLLAAQAIIVTMLTYFLIMQNTTFETPFLGMLKNGFIFALARLPINLLFAIIYPGIIIALFLIPSAITPYIGIALTLLFSGLGMLIWSLDSISLFDIYINESTNPEFFRKGLLTIENKEK